MEVCPSCKKNQNNLILHIKKSNICKGNVSEEEMKRLQDQSKNRRKQLKNERRRKARTKDHQKIDKKDNKEDEEVEDKEDYISEGEEAAENKCYVPERCPICNVKKKNILLHIKTKESCYKEIDKQDFEKWSKIARFKSKKMYQIKFDKGGGHNKARDRKRKIEKEEESYRRKKDYQLNLVMRKAKWFIQISVEFLMSLSIGETPRNYTMNGLAIYELIQKDYSTMEDPTCKYIRITSLLNEKESHAWVENISAVFLEAVIVFENVVRIPSEDWVNAVKAVEQGNKDDTKKKLFTIIGCLQANDHENTKELKIPINFKSTCKQSEATRWTQRREYNKYGGVKYLFTKEDEILLISYIENILGEDLNLIDEEIQEFLKIKDMMEGLYVAMAFASH